MMRSHFDNQLKTLNENLTQMGGACEDAIALAARCIFDFDKELLKKIPAIEREIDQYERDIEALCLKLLLRQQPVAADLRYISAALKMITDMERIGDQASDIADIIVHLGGRKGEECLYIKEMSQSAIEIVTLSIDAFIKRDLSLASFAIKKDDDIDEYFARTKEHLINMIAENTADGEYALDILMIAKYFERIGDHAVNIAEWVVFSLTGEH